MSTSEVIPVAEFRASLPEYLGLVQQDRRARVYIGARRSAQAVLMNIQENVPPSIRSRLLSGFIADVANDIVRTKVQMGGSLVLVGDMAAAVFEWLWDTDPNETVLRVADLMSAIHRHPNPDPDITLDQVLEALERSMPNAPAAVIVDMASACRDRVQYHYPDVDNPA